MMKEERYNKNVHLIESKNEKWTSYFTEITNGNFGVEIIVFEMKNSLVRINKKLMKKQVNLKIDQLHNIIQRTETKKWKEG